MSHRIIFTFVLCFLSGGWNTTAAQTITLEAVDPGPYGRGSSIAVQFTPRGVFPVAADFKFILELSDANGSFNTPVQIGSYPWHYTTFVNGVIPATANASTNYKVRVRAMRGTTELASAVSGTNISVVTTAGQSGKFIGISNWGSLNYNNSADFWMIGVCAGGQASMDIENNLNNPISVVRKNEYDTLPAFSTDQPVTYNINASGTQTIPNLKQVHYRLFIKSVVNGVVSTQAYFAVNNTTSGAYSAQEAYVCYTLTEPGYFNFKVDVDRAIPSTTAWSAYFNFPGRTYSVKWEDGSPTMVLSIQEIDRNMGLIRHGYSISSCGKKVTANNTTYYNSIGPNLNVDKISTCAQTVNVISPIQVFEKPLIDFTLPVSLCSGSNLKFVNTSKLGKQGPKDADIACTEPAITFRWRVDGAIVSTTKDLTTTLAPGPHKIRLEPVFNINALTCAPSPVEKDICIEGIVTPSLTLNGQDSVVSCAPVTINAQNTTAGVLCGSTTFSWEVYMENGFSPIAPGSGVYTVDLTDPQKPKFNFTTPGRYEIRLTSKNSCGSKTTSKKAVIVGIAGVSIPAAQTYCGVRSIDFGKDPNHKPTYSSSGNANEQYTWMITGGNYAFLNGTGASSAFPQIDFKDQSTYTIDLTFKNNCGTPQTVRQTIKFEPSITLEAGAAQTICNNTAKLALSATITGQTDSVRWSSTGSGSFSQPMQAATDYLPSGTDRSQTGVIRLIVTAWPASKSCPIRKDTVELRIKPRITANSINQSICSGTVFSYTPTGNTTGATYKWTSFVANGSVSGQAASGTGQISNTLTNTGNTDAVIHYLVVPIFDGCEGDTGSVTVTVKPVPSVIATVEKSPICSADSVRISLQPGLSGTVYSWTASGPTGISGYSNGSNQAVTRIHQRLTNISAATGDVTYVITPRLLLSGSSYCDGPATTVKVSVQPGPTPANAGPDQRLCQKSETDLSGNTIQNGTGQWSQVAGASVNIQNPSQPGTKVSGLAFGTYVFEYIVQSASGCGGSRDTVIIYNRPEIQKPAAFPDTIICDYTSGTVNIPLRATPLQSWETGLWSIISNTTGSTPSINASGMADTRLTFSGAGKIQLQWRVTNDAGCTPAGDSIVIEHFRKASAGTMSGGGAVCAGANVTFASSGLVGKVVKWRLRQASVAGNTFRDSTVTASTLTLSSIQESTDVQLIVQSDGFASGCLRMDTATVSVSVSQPSIGGVTNPDSIFCAGGANGSVQLSGHRGKILRWEASTNGGTSWSNVTGSADKTVLNYTNLSATAWYRAVIQNGVCTTVFSDTTRITVVAGTGAANAGADQALCAADTTVLTGNATGTIKSRWRQVSGQALNFADSLKAIMTVRGLKAGESYAFEYMITNDVCPPSFDTIRIVVSETTIGGVTDPDSIFCAGSASGQISLSGQRGAIQRWESSTNSGNSWSQVTGSATQTFISYNNLASTTWYRAQIKSGSCPIQYSDTTKITVVPGTGAANAGTDQRLCAADSTLLQGNGTGSMRSRWRQIGGSPLQFQDSTASKMAVRGMLPGKSYAFEYMISNDVCPPALDTVVIYNFETSIGGDANRDTIYCAGSATGVVRLTGNRGDILRWEFTTNDGANWTTVTSSAGLDQLSYANLSATRWYRAVVKNEACPLMFSDTVRITVVAGTGAAKAGADQVLCARDTTMLEGNSVTGAKVRWYQIAGPRAGHSDSTIPRMLLRDLIPGADYVFVYELDNGICPPETDTVAIQNGLPLTNQIGTRRDTVCAGFVYALNAPAASGGNGLAPVYRWQRSTDGLNFTDVASGDKQIYAETIRTTTWFRRFAQIGPCSSFSDTIFVFAQPEIAGNTLSGDTATCINTNAPNIIGTIPTGGNGVFFYAWERSTDGGASWISIPGAAGKDLDPGVLSQTTQFRRIVNTDNCSGPLASMSASITITVRPDAAVSFKPPSLSGCPPFALTSAVLNMVPDPSRNRDYFWYANDSLLGVNLSYPIYTIQKENDSVRIKLVATSRFGCKPDSASYIFRTPILPKPSFSMSDSVGCGPLSVSFQNTTPNIGLFTYSWDFGNGRSYSGEQPPAMVFLPNPTYGDTTYVITMKAISGCAQPETRKSLLVKSKPRAIFTPTRSVGCSPLTIGFNNTSKGFVEEYTWIFDDGSILRTSGRDSVSHVFTTGTQRTFYVKLVARNECGSDTTVFNIVVSPNQIRLDLAVNGTEKEGCAPQTVNFINNSSGANSFRWDFGDGNYRNTTSNLDTITHRYQFPGTYQARLTATNGCSDTTTVEVITVRSSPRALFDMSALETCVGDSLRFFNRTDSAGSNIWDFGDGKTSTIVSPAHLYDRAGTYDIRLIAYRTYVSGMVCTDTFSRRVTVVASRQVSYITKDSIGYCLPFGVGFRSPVTGALLTTWDFGDGATVTGDSVYHIYRSEGEFVVRMRSETKGGCVYLAEGRVRILAPAGLLKVDISQSCKDQTVRFEVDAVNTDSVLYEPGNGVMIRTTDRTVFYRYPNPGRYMPVITLIGPNGCRREIRATDTILVDRMVSGFTWTESRDCGLTVATFRDTARAFSGIRSVTWHVGPYPPQTGRSINSNFDVSGDYPVKLQVLANSGCVDSVASTVFIRVNAKPSVGILADSLGCTGQDVRFSGMVQSADSISYLSWSFPNGFSSTASQVGYRFAIAGKYQVRLVAGTIQGCYDTAFHQLTVNPTPVVRASDDLVLCIGQSARMSAFGANEFVWSPQQGLSCTQCPDPIVTPQTSTNYVVRGTNAFGCSSTDTAKVTVIPRMRMTVSGADSLCLGSSSQLLASGGVSWEWSPAAGLSATDIQNPVARPTNTTLYRVVGRDGYNCFTDTGYVLVAIGQPVTVDLGPDLTLPTGTQWSLRSVITNGPVKRWDWKPQTDLSCTVCPLPVATIRRTTTYQVNVTSIYGCVATDTVRITAFCESAQVFIPNAFSPDGDGVNDLLVIRAQGISAIRHFRVFNRWGEIIFERSNFQPNDPSMGWDGRIKGIAGAPEVYVYTADVVCDDGTQYTYKGNITILK